LTDDPRKARLYGESVGSETLRRRRADAVAAHAEILAEQMSELRDLDGADRGARLRLTTLMLIGGLSEAILGWLEGSLAMSREALVMPCARLAVAAADTLEAEREPT
jgi:hypothetical protein